jgi:hydroxymethylpyrimidine pyrophosphatase-like HAD family hydrolase
MIIPLGFHCNVSILNQRLHIKTETGLFEWFESRNLQHITDVINTLTINPESNIICGNGRYIYLLNTNLLSYHYDIDEYKIIFQRRYNRFIDNINKEENIYFVRINPHGCNTSKNEIELFIESIKRINPNIKFNFLLIDTIDNDCDINFITIDIDNVIFYHKHFYEKDVNDVYMRSPTIIYEIYKKILEDIGYNINETNNIIFDHRSAF